MDVKVVCLAAALLLTQLSPAQAWLRVPYEDAVVVERSELIVVGHVQPGSLAKVEHEKDSDEGRSWEYHGILIITEVLKGQIDEPEISLVFEYGLTPTEGRIGIKDHLNGITEHGRIELWDSGNSSVTFESLVPDAREPVLWFLRREAGRLRHPSGLGLYRIRDPEDVQRIELKDYFLAYLSEDVEALVHKHVARNAAVGERGRRFLDHLEVQRILDMSDPAERVPHLLPFFVERQRWQLRSEARDGLVACGDVAGPALVELFNNPDHRELRSEIMGMWREMSYTDGAGAILELLVEHNRYWTEHPRTSERFPTTRPSPERVLQKRAYRETLRAIYALGRLGDATARPVIEKTRQLFLAMDGGDQIVEQCDRALEAL